MATTFNWTIDAMNCYPKADGQTNVVYNVHWRCTGSEDDASASVYGSCAVSALRGTFTPYEKLTQEQVLVWIWANGVNKDETETGVANQIKQILSPTTITKPLPWATI